jgi:hypothetical protein
MSSPSEAFGPQRRLTIGEHHPHNAAKRCASYEGSRSAAVFLPGQVIGEKGELPIVLDGGQRQV